MDALDVQRLRTLVEKLGPLIFPDRAPRPGDQDRSGLSRLAMPHSFSPRLSVFDALIAVAGSLTRIFGLCVLFAVWGGASALAWSSIQNHFWRVAAVLGLIALFLGGLAALLIAVSAVERRVAPKR